MGKIECSCMIYNSAMLRKATEVWCDEHNFCEGIVGCIRDKIYEEEQKIDCISRASCTGSSTKRAQR